MNKLRAFIIDILLWAYISLVSFKIIYQRIILDERYPVFAWSQVTTSLIIGFVIGTILFFVNGWSVGKAFSKLYKKADHKSFFATGYGIIIALVISLTFIASYIVTQISLREFFSSSGLDGARRIFSALFHPNFAIIEDGLFAAVETIYMAFIATIIAIPFAFIISFFASRNLMSGSTIGMIAYNLIRLVLNTTRSIEPLVWAIIFSVWVGIGPFSGMLALFLHSIASLVKQYSEQIESINDGPIEAMQATGAHPIQVVWFGVVPQVVLPFLSFTIYRWDINVRMATVIGLVGGGGIGTMLMQYQGLAKWNEVGMLVILIALIVWVMDYLSSKIRESIK